MIVLTRLSAPDNYLFLGLVIYTLLTGYPPNISYISFQWDADITR